MMRSTPGGGLVVTAGFGDTVTLTPRTLCTLCDAEPGWETAALVIGPGGPLCLSCAPVVRVEGVKR